MHGKHDLLLHYHVDVLDLFSIFIWKINLLVKLIYNKKQQIARADN